MREESDPAGLIRHVEIRRAIIGWVILWALFFLICAGLGYAPLNRYDPAQAYGTSDAAAYRDSVMCRPPPPISGGGGAYDMFFQWENRYRVLVPLVAKPVYWLAKGRVGSWDPALFALLVSNAIFTATAASVLVAVGRRLKLDHATALLGAALYLLNFCVANLNLAGLVDSAEGCFLLLIVWSLLQDRWALLLLWGVLGALAKETFAPLSLMLVFGWWISEARRGRLQLARLVWICALGVVTIATVTLAMSALVGFLVWPWQFASYMRSDHGFLAELWGCLTDHTFFYVFIWLLPLGLVRLRRMPWPWVAGTAVAFCGALLLGAYNNAEGNTSRALFNVAGPLLSLSTATFLTDWRAV